MPENQSTGGDDNRCPRCGHLFSDQEAPCRSDPGCPYPVRTRDPLPDRAMDQTTLQRIVDEIDLCTPKELADGLRIAIKAYRIKASRVAGRDRQWMQDRAALMASAILEVSTGGVPL